MGVKNFNGCMPVECLKNGKNFKLINSPKGKISSKKAFSLFQRIDNALSRENSKDSFGRQYIKR